MSLLSKFEAHNDIIIIQDLPCLILFIQNNHDWEVLLHQNNVVVSTLKTKIHTKCNCIDKVCWGDLQTVCKTAYW